MGKRFTDSEKFKDIWYRKLSPKHKCLWEFLLSECNHAGIIELDLELATFLIGEEITEKDLEPFKQKLTHIEKDLYFIPNFITFQYGKLSKLSKPHIPVIKMLDKYGISYELIDEDNLTKRQVRQRLTTKAKEQIYIRDKFECQYCGSKEELEVDHIIPISKGGTNENDNLITACHRCNTSKSDKDLEEFIKDNQNNINFLDRVYKILDTLKEKEKEKEKDINKVINNNPDNVLNPIVEEFHKQMKSVLNNAIRLSIEQSNKVVELNQRIPDFKETIPKVLERLKMISWNFNGHIDNPDVNWLLKDENYISVLNGRYTTKQQIIAEKLRKKEAEDVGR